MNHLLDFDNATLRAHGFDAAVDRLVQLITDEPEDGSVVHWSMRFVSDRDGTVPERTYDYAAIRCPNNLWYCTGAKAPQGITWYELVLWIMVTNVPVSGPDLACDWGKL